MKSNVLRSRLSQQRGAATLFVAVIMLIAITLVAMLSSKTVLNETKIAANNYRAAQSVAAANYALDVGANYFDTGGFDRLDESGGTVADGNAVVAGSDGVYDSMIDVDNDGDYDVATDALTLTSIDGSQTITAELLFEKTGCGASGTDSKAGLMTATGYSDDGEAERRIYQCVGPLNALRDDGPRQPLIAQGQVALTGNARIVNRFTSTTIWSGDQVTIGSSSAMETYIRDPDLTLTSGDDGDPNTLDPNDPTDKARLLSTDEDVDTQLVSNRNLGNGLDIIDEDSSLTTLVGIEFFQNFFQTETRAELKLLADEQVYDDIGDVPDEQSGIIWIEDGTSSMTGGTIGTLDAPAIVYVAGDFEIRGTSTIYGVLYVGGTFTISGTPKVVGAVVVEGTDFSGGAEVPAAPPIVSGTGTISLIYWQGIFSDEQNNVVGLSTVIAGSWRDWE